ncbi:TonB-dependent receptor plug domain-containing protein [Ursidibacter arcticus]
MKKTVLAVFCGLYSGSLLANETQSNTSNLVTDNSATLDTIIVRAKNFSQQIGTQKITDKEIERRPTTNGNITDVLRTNPNVRFSTTSDNSQTGGEIKPNEVSFHGEKFYNNNFIVNGMSNNDNTHPGSEYSTLEGFRPSGMEAHDLPAGSTQSFWIDSSLLKSVEAFDSNISAKYGNFTGGVVDAKLTDPDLEKSHSGKIYYRYTQDEWAKFHTDNDAFESATRLDYQPQFTKQQYGLIVNQKLSEQASIRFNYTRSESDIAYYHPLLRLRDANGNLSMPSSVKDTQKRIAETYMLNGVYLPDNGDLWRAALIYSPHKAKYFKANVIDSAFTNTGGGYQVNVEWEKQLSDYLKMTTYLGYKKTENHIKHSANDYDVYRNTPSIWWQSNNNGTANAGGYGSFKSEKSTYTIKQDFDISEFDLATTQHKIGFGWQADIAQSKYIRHSDSANYLYESPNYYSLVCNGAEACIDGEQYAWKKNLYYARQLKVRDNSYSAYVEDNLSWKNLSLSLGLRYDYNHFLGKHNLAPRFSGSYDLFGDEKTQLFAGYNRYYAGSMLAYKLRQGISNYLIYQRNQYSDGTLGEWLRPGNAYNNTYDVSQLRNPYSDEYVLGLGQKFLGMDWVFKWVHRNARDQFVSKWLVENGRRYRGLTNDGWQKNDSFTFSVKAMAPYEFKYAKVGWDLGFSYNKTKTNNSWYQQEELGNRDYLVYNDKLYYATGGLTPTDFNNPYQIFLNINTEFPKWRLSWDQRFSYIGGKNYIENSGTIMCNGSATVGTYRGACGDYVGEVDIYRDAHQSSHFLVDWRFSYKQPVIQDQYLELTLDINNVLDRKAVAKSAGSNTVYKMGRNFWAGVSYNW